MCLSVCVCVCVCVCCFCKLSLTPSLSFFMKADSSELRAVGCWFSPYCFLLVRTNENNISWLMTDFIGPKVELKKKKNVLKGAVRVCVTLSWRSWLVHGEHSPDSHIASATGNITSIAADPGTWQKKIKHQPITLSSARAIGFEES